jgi:hypothetical protein
MEKKRISREEKEKIIQDLYYNQNKTYREITEIAGTYPREIKTILKKADPSRSQSISSQAYQLFSEGKTVTHVAITLDIRQPEASELFTEYWLLQQQDQLYRIFQEIKNDIHFFLQLYRQALAAGMNIQDVIGVLVVAKNDLRSIEYRYQELKRQADSLAASNRNAANTFQDLSDQICDMKKTLNQYSLLCKERRLEFEKLGMQMNKLQASMTNIQNNSEECSKIKDTVKGEIENVLTNPKQTLSLALHYVIESVRINSSYLNALVYNFPSTNSPGHSLLTTGVNQYNYVPCIESCNSEETYERFLLDEAEKLYAKMVVDFTDKVIGDTANRNKQSQTELPGV